MLGICLYVEIFRFLWILVLVRFIVFCVMLGIVFASLLVCLRLFTLLCACLGLLVVMIDIFEVVLLSNVFWVL